MIKLQTLVLLKKWLHIPVCLYTGTEKMVVCWTEFVQISVWLNRPEQVPRTKFHPFWFRWSGRFCTSTCSFDEISSPIGQTAPSPVPRLTNQMRCHWRPVARSPHRTSKIKSPQSKGNTVPVHAKSLQIFADIGNISYLQPNFGQNFNAVD
jgi:hypothetical protein